MITGNPGGQVFWVASRALGIVALVVLAASVGLGLALSGRLVRRAGLPAALKHYHEACTLVALGLIVAHGGVLLADGYLRPSLRQVVLPFALAYRPVWTGIGVVAAWLAAVLGLGFYVRRLIGVRTWRRLHRLTPLVYVLVLAHTLGAGTDRRSPWMLGLLAALTAPLVFMLILRMLPGAPVSAGARRSPPAGGTPRPAR